MKQLLSHFILLLPCIVLAQYPTNGNQKITLGEQTTADGLIYRGVLGDTALITPLSDTSAYIILDTVNNRFFHYKRNTNVWSIAGGSDTSLIAYVNTYGTQTVNGAKTFTSPVTATKLNVTDSIQTNTGVYKINATTVGLNVDNTTPFRVTTGGNWGVYNDNPQNLLNLFSSSARGGVISNSYPILMFNEVGNSRFLFGLDANEAYLWGQASVRLSFATNNTEKLRIETNGDVGIGTFGSTSPSEKLHVVGNARITAVGAGTFSNNLNITSDGTLTTATSDEKFKYNIRPINYGLETLLQLNPVNFQWIEGEEEDLGFIAQDVAEIIPEAVNTNWNSDLLFRYESLIPILTKAIQQQQAQIEALKQRLLILENK